jgi:hypothetical protein
MTSLDNVGYLAKLLSQRDKEDAAVLVWELLQALSEKQEREETLSIIEQQLVHLCTVQTCNGIEEILTGHRDSIEFAANFAREAGFTETAQLLSDALNDKPVAGPVSLTANIHGVETSIPIPAGRWGATDIALSMIDEGLNDAILDFAEANAAAFALEAPAAVAEKETTARQVADVAASQPAVAIIAEILSHRDPRILAQIRDGERSGTDTDWIELPVMHHAGKPLPSQVLAGLAKKYGAAAKPLLDIYAKYDGLELFAVSPDATFYFLPVDSWAEHHDNVMSWATEVTWNDAPGEIPAYLRTAIAFGYIPGDYERWLLITEGEHAGKIMLSDTDVINDTPRFESLAHFAAALIHDIERTLGSGGYISYNRDGTEAGDYYPERYVFSGQL